jgi:hypothetical protein
VSGDNGLAGSKIIRDLLAQPKRRREEAVTGLKITRLKLTEMAAAQLDALGLSLADLVCVICFARKTREDEAQTYRFEIEQVPADVRGELEHLAGLELRVVSGEIVSAMRLAMNETSTLGSLTSANCKAEEEKR